MKNLLKFQTLTAEDEQIETLVTVGTLRVERPQSDFKGGWIPQWTILTPYHDIRGYNRQYGTFSRKGLEDIRLIKREVK